MADFLTTWSEQNNQRDAQHREFLRSQLAPKPDQLDAAVEMLHGYDAEQHAAEEYVVRIARAVLNASKGT